MKKYLVVLNQDKRLIYLVNKLKESHDVETVSDQKNLEKLIKNGKYTHLLLPVPGVDNTLTIRGTHIQLTNDLFKYMKGKTILSGLIHDKLKEACADNAISLTSYLTKQFMIENNYITSEGIVQKLVELSDKSIYNANILIIGYGRLGQILAKILKAFHANITIAARNPKDLTNASIQSYHTKSINMMDEVFEQVDFIVNTVPARIISEAMLERLRTMDVLILDASSQPYGLDFEYANKHHMNAFMLPQIPGKIAPITSGELLAHYVSLL